MLLICFHQLSFTVNICLSNPCGAGTCDISEPDVYSCVCDAQHFGDHCEKGSCTACLSHFRNFQFTLSEMHWFRQLFHFELEMSITSVKSVST